MSTTTALLSELQQGYDVVTLFFDVRLLSRYTFSSISSQCPLVQSLGSKDKSVLLQLLNLCAAFACAQTCSTTYDYDDEAKHDKKSTRGFLNNCRPRLSCPPCSEDRRLERGMGAACALQEQLTKRGRANCKEERERKEGCLTQVASAHKKRRTHPH